MAKVMKPEHMIINTEKVVWTTASRGTITQPVDVNTAFLCTVLNFELAEQFFNLC